MKEGSVPLLVLCMILIGSLHMVSATQIGMNYYHETMMNSQGYHYIDRTLSQIDSDLNDIKTLTNYVKVYANPLISDNVYWTLKVALASENKGMYTVVAMNTEDRILDNSNWQSYTSSVLAACRLYNGKVDEFLVGNEISLHTSFSKAEIQPKIVDLINQCKKEFSGIVSYEAFWYEKDNWKGYTGRIYFNLYEDLTRFNTNTLEMNKLFGSNAYVGEFGDQLINNNQLDQDSQASEINNRWNIIQSTSSPVAYVFTYREPSASGFGIVDLNGNHLKAWNVFTNSPTNTIVSPTPTTTSPTSPSLLSSLVPSCSYGTASCSKTSDTIYGNCRLVSFSTQNGPINIFACDKTTNIEIYRKEYPLNTPFKACLGSACVNEMTGFATISSTTPITSPSVVTSPSTTTTPTTTQVYTIGQLTQSCNVDGRACTPKSDIIDGTCRTIVSSSISGDIAVKGCDKGSGWFELYLQKAPIGNYKFCLSNGCVTNGFGFARFQLTTSQSTTPIAPKVILTSSQPSTTTVVQSSLDVSSLQVSVTPAGNKVGDFLEGNDCRKVQFISSEGWLEARICSKVDKYEMYFLSGTQYASICVGSSCVNSQSGFVSFK